MESVLRMVTRKDVMSKLGKPIYSFTLYEKKVKRATILLENSNNSDIHLFSWCPSTPKLPYSNKDSSFIYKPNMAYEFDSRSREFISRPSPMYLSIKMLGLAPYS